MHHTAARPLIRETVSRVLPTQNCRGRKGVRIKNAELYTAEYYIVGHCYMNLYIPLTLQYPRCQK